MDDHRAHIVQRLSQRIAMRATADPQHSYTARLLQGPKEAVLRKVGEEALEVVLAAQSTDRAALIGELADLWYHTMVAAQRCSIDPAEVFAGAAVLNRPRRGFCRTGKALHRGG